MLLADPVIQKRNRRFVTKGRMLSLPAVKDLDVLKAGGLHVGMSGITNPMLPRVFEVVESTLCRCVSPAVFFSAHRAFLLNRLRGGKRIHRLPRHKPKLLNRLRGGKRYYMGRMRRRRLLNRLRGGKLPVWPFVLACKTSQPPTRRQTVILLSVLFSVASQPPTRRQTA